MKRELERVWYHVCKGSDAGIVRSGNDVVKLEPTKRPALFLRRPKTLLSCSGHARRTEDEWMSDFGFLAKPNQTFVHDLYEYATSIVLQANDHGRYLWIHLGCCSR